MSRKKFLDATTGVFFAWCEQIKTPLTRDEIAAAHPMPVSWLKYMVLKAKDHKKIFRVGSSSNTRWVSAAMYEEIQANRRDRILKARNEASKRWWKKESVRRRGEIERDAESWSDRKPEHRWVSVWPPMSAPPGPPSVFHLGAWK